MKKLGKLLRNLLIICGVLFIIALLLPDEEEMPADQEQTSVETASGIGTQTGTETASGAETLAGAAQNSGMPPYSRNSRVGSCFATARRRYSIANPSRAFVGGRAYGA